MQPEIDDKFINLMETNILDLISAQELKQLDKSDVDGKFRLMLRYVDMGVHHTRASMICGFSDEYTSDLLSKGNGGPDHYLRRSLLLRAERLRIARLEYKLHLELGNPKLTPKIIMELLARLAPDQWGLQSEVNVNLNRSLTQETADLVNKAMNSLDEVSENDENDK